MILLLVLLLGVLCVTHKTLVFTFSAYNCFAVSLPHTPISFFSELTHAFSFYADTMLGKNMLADLKALARNHGLATGSQMVPNSAVEKAIIHGRSPPKEPTQRKKLVLKR